AGEDRARGVLVEGIGMKMLDRARCLAALVRAAMEDRHRVATVDQALHQRDPRGSRSPDHQHLHGRESTSAARIVSGRWPTSGAPTSRATSTSVTSAGI